MGQGEASSDPISGRNGLAPLALRGLGAGFVRLGAVGLAPGESAFLDSAEGGGVIVSARPIFDLLGRGPSGNFAVGVHGTSAPPIQVLGGDAGWKGVEIKGWKADLSVSYQSAVNAWTLKGSAQFPNVFKGIGGLGVTGKLREGKVNAFGVEAQTPDIPLGSSGFVLTKFTGELAGLAGGPKNPITLTIGTGGGWGPKLPVINRRVLNLDSAQISVDTGLNGRITGSISLVDSRLAKGNIDLGMGLDPFRASGSLNASVKLVVVEWEMGTQTDMNSSHFTGTGEAKLKVWGRTVNRAAAIVSDEGAGTTARLCFLPRVGCKTIGFGIRWRNVRFPLPKPDLIGADIERYRTITTARSRNPQVREIRVPVTRSDVVLAVSAQSAGTVTDIELVSPSGGRRTLARPGQFASAQRASNGREAILMLGGPERGDWQVRIKGDGNTSVEVQRAPALKRLAVRSARPASTKRRRLRRRSVTIGWSPQGLSPRARVEAHVSPRRGQPGPLVASQSVRRGQLKLLRRFLSRGANYITLVVTDRRVPYQAVRLKRPLWR